MVKKFKVLSRLFSAFIIFSLITPNGFLFTTVYAADPVVIIDTINGDDPTGHCIAGPVTIVGHGTTGNQGGPYELDINWGDTSSVVTLDDDSPEVTGKLKGANENFSFVISHTPIGPSTGLTLFLHHATASGNDSGVINVNLCVAPPTQGVLTVAKHVINNDGGTATAPNFTLHVKQGGIDVTGSSFSGLEDGTDFLLNPGTYSVSEDPFSGYTQTSISCENTTDDTPIAGSDVALLAGKNYHCVITNNDIANTPPVLSDVPGSSTIPELAAYTFTASTADADVPPQTLTYSLVGAPTGAAIDAAGVFTWTPTEAQGPGVYAFSVQVSDGSVSDSATTTLTVTEVNVAPVAQDQSSTVDEDAGEVITLVATDSDVPTQVLTYTIVSDPTHGTLSLFDANTGAVTYTPEANYNGPDSFTFSANDAEVDSNVATVSITVAEVNDAPVADAQSVSTDEDTAVNVVLTGSDIDVPVQTLSFAITQPANGTAVLSGNQVTYTPNANYNGADSFTFTVNDGSITSAPATVSITVNPTNDVPVAQNASVSTALDVALLISLVGMDIDFGDVLTYEIVAGPGNGSIGGMSGNELTYTPNSGFAGADSFTFKVNDGTADSNVATISITVSNDAPILSVINDASVNELTTLTFTASATDPNGDPLTYSLTGTIPEGAAISSIGEFSWTPTEAQGPGVYTIMVRVTDGPATDTKSFVVTVNEVNALPVADEKNLVVDEDTAGNVTLSAIDSDNPVQTLTFVITSQPAHGTLVLAGNIVTYTPNVNYNGTDSFAYAANDGVTDGTPVTASITVNPINDAPTIALVGANPFSFVSGNDFIDPGATASDVEDGELTPVVTGGPLNASTASGTYMLVYTATDSGSLSASTTREVIVTAQPVENTIGLCSDGIDNNNNEAIDLNDQDCAQFKPKLTVIKVVINDNGRTKSVSDFPLFINATSTISGVQVVMNTLGTSTVSETGDQNYTASFSGDCDASGQVSLALGDVKTCTITNNDNSTGGGGGGGGVVIPPGSGGGSGGTSAPAPTPAQGQVLGASTSCGIYIKKFLRVGYKNDPDNVTKLQNFLNDYLKSDLPITGVFGQMTEAAVRKFQAQEKSSVLDPWKIAKPTGIVYLTTTRHINNLMCPELQLPLPAELIEFSKNKEVPVRQSS